MIFRRKADPGPGGATPEARAEERSLATDRLAQYAAEDEARLAELAAALVDELRHATGSTELERLPAAADDEHPPVVHGNEIIPAAISDSEITDALGHLEPRQDGA